MPRRNGVPITLLRSHMQLNVGDRVRFLNEVGGGEIVARIDARTVVVRCEDGFEIPTLQSELILDRPLEEHAMPAARSAEVTRASHAGAAKQAPVSAPAPKVDPHLPLRAPIEANCSLVLGFSPRDESDSLAGPFDVYVINEGSQRALITLARWEGTQVVNVFAGKLKPNSARLVTTIEAEDLFLYVMLHVQVLRYSQGPAAMCPPESYDVEIKRTKFTRPGAFQSNRFLDVPLVTVTVADAQREALLAASMPEAVEVAKATKELNLDAKPRQVEPPREEVVIDLHLEALCPHQLSFTPKEALDFQLQHFERAIEEALQQQSVKRFVAIHGVGNGRLRREVIDVLRAKYPGCTYQDASFKEYGYGATLVHLVRNASEPRKH